MFRGVREHNNYKAPYAQSDGYFNHINRFNNPHNDGNGKGVKLTYE